MLRKATHFLETHQKASPRLDAELLLAHALELRRLDLYLQFERLLSESELQRYRELIDRRRRGEPVAYLIGHKEFMQLDFKVTPAVLVPNPATETLVERAVAMLKAQGGEVRVADVGTGSGCIAVALAHYLPDARIWASDIDEVALAVAAENVQAHNLADRIRLCPGDLLEPLSEQFDLICANLPYVDPADEAGLPAEVLAQPRHALFAAEAGAALIRRLLQSAREKLAPGGHLLAEIGPHLQAAIDLSGFAGHCLHKDLSGEVRVLEVWR
ncbi:MAG: peptide chain release factor N(5)-glutamine methyltransferase [Candidatus Dormibacteraceae bacterium]